MERLKNIELSMGLQMPPDQWNEFITQLLQEIQDVK